jgi:flagellar biosynthesis protein FlhB
MRKIKQLIITLLILCVLFIFFNRSFGNILNILQNKLNPNYTSVASSTSEGIAEMTLFVNGMNNIISTYNYILTFIGIVIAVYGILSFNKIHILSKNINSITNELKKFKTIENNLEVQNKSIEKSTNHIFSLLSSFIEKNEDPEMNRMIHEDMNLVNLYSPYKQTRIAAIQYFAINGTKAHLDDIRYVSENDLDEETRKFALRVLGRIDERGTSKIKV